MPNKKQAEVKETPEYHNTYLLLKKYRDVVWNLSCLFSGSEINSSIEMGSSIEDFLGVGIYSGLDFSGIRTYRIHKKHEESRQMLRLIELAVEMLRYKHKKRGNVLLDTVLCLFIAAAV